MLHPCNVSAIACIFSYFFLCLQAENAAASFSGQRKKRKKEEKESLEKSTLNPNRDSSSDESSNLPSNTSRTAC